MTLYCYVLLVVLLLLTRIGTSTEEGEGEGMAVLTGDGAALVAAFFIASSVESIINWTVSWWCVL